MHEFQEYFSQQPTASDKISHHGYHRAYPWFLGHYVGKEVDLLEIGVDKTSSLRLWKNYFRKVRLCGIDRDEKVFPDGDVRLFQVDQSRAEELRQFRMVVGTEFDIIIDDGSHIPEHQVLTLNELWSLLKPGGVYIIEDIETSYWGKSELYGYRFDAQKVSAVAFATQLIDEVNSEFRPSRKEKTPHATLAKDVEIVAFSHNCVILVKKDVRSFGSYYNRDYVLASSIGYNSLWRRFRRWVGRMFKS